LAMSAIFLGREGMTLEHLIAISRSGAQAKLTEGAEKRLRETRKLVEKWVQEEKTIYGITTGFGALSDVAISKRDTRQLQQNILMSHAAGVGDPLDEGVAHEVHLGDADFFVAAREDDQKNLIDVMMAKKWGAKRTAIITKEPDIVQILGSLDVDVVVNARLLTVAEILRFVKPGKVLSVKKIGDSEAEIIEVVVGKGSKAVGRSLREMKLPEGALVGAIYRNGVAIIPDGNSQIEQGDTVVAFVLPKVGKKLERLFAGRKRITFVENRGN